MFDDNGIATYAQRYELLENSNIINIASNKS